MMSNDSKAMSEMVHQMVVEAAVASKPYTKRLSYADKANAAVQAIGAVLNYLDENDCLNDRFADQWNDYLTEL